MREEQSLTTFGVMHIEFAVNFANASLNLYLVVVASM
jgi:hypothetical protein